ncbi:sugar kinase [Leptolyngbya cf. ectocarpi LEGE 11479]|uniref:Sugar kinase n=1 Tax=Leptolyngbya cf. ectocarpi LEGE 11479 TaxID=1828722 RepID=A0A928X292_LEPEC|nr:PfkB family carbohydrate kinase [Leptolyngbya ectocarpi]MBE9066046.1 sugar kinase [Leptolyngbya cf. ectocarpi LEGE 11479]
MQGLFVGLMTLDCIYQAQRPPQANEKLVAQDVMMAAGGPATNAAVAFSALGGTATIMAAVGQHPVTALLREDLAHVGVGITDLTLQRQTAPPVSSIVVSAASGERAVISRNAVGLQVEHYPIDLTNIDVVLLDGHQMALSHQVAMAAQSANIPVVVDAGSWKPGFDQVLSLATVVIASANFQPPDGQTALTYLQGLGIPYVAITHGEHPITVSEQGQVSELPVPATAVVDTLGAGDIFHGAFCYAWAGDFLAALAQAAQVASSSCQYFGTRAWIADSLFKS